MTREAQHVLKAGLLIFVGLALLALVTLVSGGCAASERVVKVVETGAKVVAITEPLMLAAYQESQRICLVEFSDTDEATRCVERIRVRWAPVLAALGDYRDAYCAVLPDRCGP